MCVLLFFFFNDTATTEIYTLSLHDALPILHAAPPRRDAEPRGRAVDQRAVLVRDVRRGRGLRPDPLRLHARDGVQRSEEHTSELQSRQYLVCRLLLEKKKKRARTRRWDVCR